MNGLSYVTKQAFEQMRLELQRMKTIERPAASRAIAEAREKGVSPSEIVRQARAARSA